MKLSIIIPAYNEEKNIVRCLDELRDVLRAHDDISYEFVIVNDHSGDGTEDVVRAQMAVDPHVRLVNRQAPSGFGRAVRAGLEVADGDAVVIYMADCSDDPRDAIAYYRKLQEGYDCVYGSRFIKGATVQNYPRLKRVINRIINKMIQWLFWCQFNDLTNAFKCYRTAVLRDCGPYHASHFNITLEMSLSPLIRNYSIAQIPVNWYGRTWGSSNLKLREMGRRYFSTLASLFFQRMLIQDDLIAEKLAHRQDDQKTIDELAARVERLEAERSPSPPASSPPPSPKAEQRVT